MSKYDPLTTHLKSLGYSHIPMRFEEIENVIGVKLPPSAFKHRPWWSNNPSNSVITYAWLKAGYKTASVDMSARKLVFEKQEERFRHGGEQERSSDDPKSGMEEKPADFEPKGGGGEASLFGKLYGCLKGSIKIAPGVGLTKPAWGEEEWEAWEAKWDRLLPQKDSRA